MLVNGATLIDCWLSYWWHVYPIEDYVTWDNRWFDRSGHVLFLLILKTDKSFFLHIPLNMYTSIKLSIFYAFLIRFSTEPNIFLQQDSISVVFILSNQITANPLLRFRCKLNSDKLR